MEGVTPEEAKGMENLKSIKKLGLDILQFKALSHKL